MDFTDLDSFDKFVRFPEELEKFKKQQVEMLNRMVRVEEKQNAVEGALAEFAQQNRVHDAVMRGIDETAKVQTTATIGLQKTIEEQTATHNFGLTVKRSFSTTLIAYSLTASI